MNVFQSSHISPLCNIFHSFWTGIRLLWLHSVWVSFRPLGRSFISLFFMSSSTCQWNDFDSMAPSPISTTPLILPNHIVFSSAPLTLIDLELHHFCFRFQQQPSICFFHCSGLVSLAHSLMANIRHIIYTSPLLCPRQPQLFFLQWRNIVFLLGAESFPDILLSILNLQYAPHFLAVEWSSEMYFLEVMPLQEMSFGSCSGITAIREYIMMALVPVLPKYST